jgi:hypothetical protein
MNTWFGEIVRVVSRASTWYHERVEDAEKTQKVTIQFVGQEPADGDYSIADVFGLQG